MPYVVKGMDVSFSGLCSHVDDLYSCGGTLASAAIVPQRGPDSLLLLAAARGKGKGEKPSRADVCFSLQETIFAMLVEITERALAHTNKDSVLVVGGVGCACAAPRPQGNCNAAVRAACGGPSRQRAAAGDDGGHVQGAGGGHVRNGLAVSAQHSQRIAGLSSAHMPGRAGRRYCIDNGAMIAQAGVCAYRCGERTALADTWCTQR